jgi:NitT/TauT family transport system permease protein
LIAMAALPEILAGVRACVICSAKGVVNGRFLVWILGIAARFALYSLSFLMTDIAALILFALALSAPALIARVEARFEH